MKILLTSTSFQDTPGKHQELLKEKGFEIDNLRGPLKESVLLPIIGDYDAIICGDDEITENVLKNAKNGRLKVISKYGIGLDKVDLIAAKKYEIPVTNCPGVNQDAVAEHVFALILAFEKNIVSEVNFTNAQKWERLIGHEIYGKSIGVIGLGNVGREIVKRARAFGMNVHGFDRVRDEEFINEYNVTFHEDVKTLFSEIDILSLNVSLNSGTSKIINSEAFNLFKEGVLLVNTARAGLIDHDALLENLTLGKLRGYLTDVLEEEPMTKNEPLHQFENVLITPHIGSRTYETVERQGLMAVNNLLELI
jgi:D-3-phosphoglycerate dehydrogenase